MTLFLVCHNSLNTKLILGVIIHIKCWQSNKDDGNDCEDERWTAVGQDCVHDKL